MAGACSGKSGMIPDSKQYLGLESYRRDGRGVRTPVWFAANGPGRLIIYSATDAGKVKRIRRNGQVRIAPCTATGRVTGTWIDAQATLLSGDEAQRCMRLLDRKYWPWKALLGLMARLRPGSGRVVIALTPR